MSNTAHAHYAPKGESHNNTTGEAHKNSATKQRIERRLEFMHLDKESCSSISKLKPLVERELANGLDIFYSEVRKSPEVKRFFSSEEHISRAKNSQLGHWDNIASGKFNEDYLNNVRKIGSVHARIGLEPQWYIGGYAVILGHLIDTAVKEHFPKGGLFSKKTMTAEDFAKSLSNLVKGALLDMDLAISVNMDEAEAAKKKAQAEAIANEQRLVCETFGNAMAAIAAKDVSYRIEADLPEAYHTLRDDFNAALEQLSSTIQQIDAGASDIHANAEEMRSGADDLAKRTEHQAASIEETAAALEEITRTVKESSTRAVEAEQLVVKAKAGAEKTGDVVKRAVSAMGVIEKSSHEISNIIGVIDEIAFQTNLLALNAGVEAARAGEAGKGFAVVAQEVRELAQRSANAAKEIKTLITASGEQVKNGAALVGETGHALQAIVSDVDEINKNIADIVGSAKEQAIALQEINSAIGSMDQTTQQNAAMVEESNASIQMLATEIHRIARMLSEFDTGRKAPAPRSQSQQKPASPARNASAHELQGKLAKAYQSQGNAAVENDSWEDF